MNLLGSLVIAFSMYSRIPMPKVSWSQERMKYALCFFPLIGLVMGICLWLWGQVSEAVNLGPLAYAAGGTVLPLVITGGIHMDGFLDVSDARSSYGEKEKKLEILKDPHIGAFAMIKGSVYLLTYLAVFSELPVRLLPVVGGVYVLTRAMSGLSVVVFPKAKKEGLAASFSHGARQKAVMASMLCYIVVSVGFLASYGGWRIAGAVVCCCVLVFGGYYRTACREFGGMTGDLAGWFLQIEELALVAVTAVMSRV